MLESSVFLLEQRKLKKTFFFLHAYRFQEEWTRDIAAPGCSKDNVQLHQFNSSSAPARQVVPGHSAAGHAVNTIHVVEVYGHKDRYNKPSCQIPG